MTTLILNVCKEKLHYFEFVRPVEKILEKNKKDFYTKHYTKFEDKDLKVGRIIICGTSLIDMDYLKNLKLFKWIDFYKKPILGICAGAQILFMHFKGDLHEQKEIGLINVEFKRDFLGIKEKSKIESYALHKLSLVGLNLGDFEAYAKSSKGVEAIKHESKPFYGVLFHPEVRNEKIIENFGNL